jgi:acyl phosphate:glycerol-3-phosphate acyltransferase
MELFSGSGREVALICIGYALGCFSTGYYLVRCRTRQDIRILYSGTAGSTNAGRILGKSGHFITLIGDAGKAAIALGAARYFGASQWGIAAVAIAIVAGHIWPVQLNFHGGKGLAPALGIISVLDYRAALIAGGAVLLGSLLGWGLAMRLVAAAISPIIIALLNHGAPDITAMAVLALLILLAHRDNIRAFIAEKRGRKGLQT